MIHRTKFNKIMLLILIISLLLTIGCSAKTNNQKSVVNSYDLIVHFIDVGQADSILIQFPNGETALIDGGNRGDGNIIVEYLQKNNISKIDYLLATHPHEDHIGGLPDVVKNFQIDNVYMPRKSATTKIFESFIDELNEKGIKAIVAKGGLNIIDDGELNFTILAPNSEDYSETNEYSIVCKLEYKDSSFLFTGDAESVSEKEMINKGYDLSADVLKVGHHGGSTSTTEEFLDYVNPKMAVISVGEENDYGHPHEETIERFKDENIPVMRTSELGTIIISTDGHKITTQGISFNDSDLSNVEEKEEIVIGNINTKVYHLESCNSLPNTENQIIFKSRTDAENAGYRPHNSCVK